MRSGRIRTAARGEELLRGRGRVHTVWRSHGWGGPGYPGARRGVSGVAPGAGRRLWRRLRGSPGCGRGPPEAPSKQDAAGGGAGGAALAQGAAAELGRGSMGLAGGRVGTQISP